MQRLVNGTDKGQVFRTIADQIAEHRDTHPRSIALSCGDQSLSYEQLDRAAHQFTAYLAQLGVRPDDTVAICMERSFDWIVAALGIMRAGVAYVPLDPAWPDSRLRFAVEDSGATVLVARTELFDRLQVKARCIDPARDAAAIAGAVGAALPHIQPDGLAYVIYTSGSTGVPKGVEITHANLAHLIRWHRDTFNVMRQDRASHLAGLGFDAAVWEIWPHLSAGATVCLADDVVRLSPDLLKQWLVRERVTITFVPTVHVPPMLAMEWPATTELRLLLTGGDALHHAPAVQLPFDVINNYGPTECTVVATSSLLKPGLHGTPPIGLPIAGTTIYLLNEDREQVPDGSIGEIYIGGSGVGRGYRNLPDLTERSFLPDPFSGAPHGRMYRTGDRGVRRPDGEIEFHGRLDRQTKICGQRVELDEIGSILTRHPRIDFAAAVTSISQRGEKHLAAFILPKENAPVPTTCELQNLLRHSLPDYMIPTIFARLPGLPLSANGKIDLTMLPQLADAQSLEGVDKKAPAAPIAERLLTMVRTLLENDAVDAEDSFFLAGGHSLLGMQLVMRVHNEFGVNLTLRQLFEAPTVKRLALLVETMLTDAVDSVNGVEVETPVCGQRTLVAELSRDLTVRRQVDLPDKEAKGETRLPPGVLAVQPNGARDGFFWLHYSAANLAKVIGDDQPLFSVALTEEDLSSLGERPTLQRIATCLLRKILTVQSEPPYTIGGFCLGGILAYEIASQLRATGREVALLVLLDAPNPSYIESCDSITRWVSYLPYVIRRAVRLGPRTSLVYLRQRLLKRISHSRRTTAANTEILVQDITEAAAFAYHPEKYDRDVLLMLASEHPPYADILPGWQAVVSGNLDIHYLEAHHRDLQEVTYMRIVAKTILSRLIPTGSGKSSSRRAYTSSLTDSVANRNLTRSRFEDEGVQ